jgi:xanthine dehydrogenase YagS FAD-binding subunit
MKSFVNRDAHDAIHAARLLAEARNGGRPAAIVGGGSDLLGMIKDGLVAPDVLVNLKTIRSLDRIRAGEEGVAIGALTTLAALARDPLVRSRLTVLAEAAESVATPQIRTVGTLAGNVCQRPWCWYFRNGFPCLKNGGNQCFAAGGENQFHAIFGGGPSHIVHPSDTAAALVALGASFNLHGGGGPDLFRTVPAEEFFQLPRVNPARENVLEPDELLAQVHVPLPRPGTRSTYHKVLDREAWTHAIVSAAVVLEMDGAMCRTARIVLGGVAPVPWRLPEVEKRLAGQQITPALAEEAAEIAIAGAKPLAKNGYKVPLTRSIVRRTLIELASRA